MTIDNLIFIEHNDSDLCRIILRMRKKLTLITIWSLVRRFLPDTDY